MDAQSTRNCPKCGFEERAGSAECRRCGIVFAKYVPGRDLTPPHLRTVSRERGRAPGGAGSGRRRTLPINGGKWLVALVVIGAIAAYFYFDKPYEVVGATPAQAEKVLILMHGFGAPGDDLVPRAESLSNELPGVSFVVLEAPHHRGFVGRAWMIGGTRAATMEQVAESRARVIGTIEDLEADGVDASRIYLGGYSQGAQMALDIAMNEDTAREFAGLVLLSGGWPGWPEAPGPESLGSPQLAADARVLVTHGRSDGVVSFSSGESVADSIGRVASTQFVALDGAHRITSETETAIVEFLAAR